MKLNNTYLLFDSGDTANKEEWAKAHSAIANAISSMTWPDVADVTNFKIPRIVTVQPAQSYIGRNAKSIVVTDKRGRTLRNGVGPIRNQFRQRLSSQGWKPEHPLSLAEFFKTLRDCDRLEPFRKYPLSVEEVKADVLNESVGDCDFWFKTDSGFRTVVEWETGNISSSHRSLNKMCMVLMGGLADAGVLIVPSIKMYPHLTDRIGNVRELQPYFYFWGKIGAQVQSGLLAVVESNRTSFMRAPTNGTSSLWGRTGTARRRKRENPDHRNKGKSLNSPTEGSRPFEVLRHSG